MNRIDLAHPRYTIMVWGSLPPERVRMDYDPRRRPKLGKEQAETVAADAEAMRARGLKVENHPLYCFHGCTCSPAMLLLKLGHCEYEQYLSLNRLHRDWGERADALGLAVALEAPEGFVLEERSQEVAEAPGLLHVKPSGHAHPPETLLEAVHKEAGEELGLDPKELSDLVSLGLVRIEGTDKVIAIYSGRTAVSLEEITGRTRADGWESERLLTAPADAEGLSRWLVEQGERMTAAGHAALVMEGWRRHGHEWLQDLWKRL